MSPGDLSHLWATCETHLSGLAVQSESDGARGFGELRCLLPALRQLLFCQRSRRLKVHLRQNKHDLAINANVTHAISACAALSDIAWGVEGWQQLGVLSKRSSTSQHLWQQTPSQKFITAHATGSTRKTGRQHAHMQCIMLPTSGILGGHLQGQSRGCLGAPLLECGLWVQYIFAHELRTLPSSSRSCLATNSSLQPRDLIITSNSCAWLFAACHPQRNR